MLTIVVKRCLPLIHGLDLIGSEKDPSLRT